MSARDTASDRVTLPSADALVCVDRLTANVIHILLLVLSMWTSYPTLLCDICDVCVRSVAHAAGPSPLFHFTAYPVMCVCVYVTIKLLES